MTLPGTIDEWELISADQLRWQRKDHPEDGVLTLREGLSFKDYYAKRAEPPPEPEADKLADLESRIAKLEASSVLAATK